MAAAKKNLKIVSKREGFRRGGRDWSGETVVSPDDFSKVQLKQINDEKMLIVTEVDEEVTDETKTGEAAE